MIQWLESHATSTLPSISPTAAQQIHYQSLKNNRISYISNESRNLVRDQEVEGLSPFTPLDSTIYAAF